MKQLKAMKPIMDDNFYVPKVYKDNEDKAFVKDLFRKTILNEAELAKEFVDKTPNWDSDRIAEILLFLKWLFVSF
jgi:N utilization substance protein B